MKTEPLNVFLNRVYVFGLFFGGVGIVKTQVAKAAVFFGGSKSMQIAFAWPMCRYPLGSGGKRV